jgi:Tol biopolymer transport system component
MDKDGANQTNVSQNPAPDYGPAWSPDGLKLAFVSERDGNPEVYIVDADGSNPVNVTHDTARDSAPTWRLTR